MHRTYTIRQLTKEFGVTARTLRFYEDEGLIAPERRGQTRLYSSRDRARITLILRGRRVGFALAEIREILDLYDTHRDGGRAQTLHARKKFEEQLSKLERQREDIDLSMSQLKHAIRAIDDALSSGAPYKGAGSTAPHAMAAE